MQGIPLETTKNRHTKRTYIFSWLGLLRSYFFVYFSGHFFPQGRYFVDVAPLIPSARRSVVVVNAKRSVRGVFYRKT